MAYVVVEKEKTSVSGHNPGDTLDESRFSEAKIQKMRDSGVIEEVSETPKNRGGRPRKPETSEGEGETPSE